MSRPYEEILSGEIAAALRAGRAARSDLRTPARVDDGQRGESSGHAIAGAAHPSPVSRSTTICPDLALVTVATGKLWLAVEIISRDDHQADTVIKKQLYEDIRVPRLWMVDPRYDNVEIYHMHRMGAGAEGHPGRQRGAGGGVDP